MLNFSVKLLIGVVLTASTLFAADNSLGTWKRNIAQSKSSTPGSNPDAVKSWTMVREASGNGVKVTNTVVRQDGTEYNWGYTVQYDGKEYPVTGNSASFDTIAFRQIDANTFATVFSKKGGKYRTTGRVVISKDGKTYTHTATGTNSDGKSLTQTLVYDRQ